MISVPFVFDNPLTRGAWSDDLFLALTMQSQWISFAVHLDPNYHGGMLSRLMLVPHCCLTYLTRIFIVEGIPYWPDYANGTKNIVYRNSTEGMIIYPW